MALGNNLKKKDTGKKKETETSQGKVNEGLSAKKKYESPKTPVLSDITPVSPSKESGIPEEEAKAKEVEESGSENVEKQLKKINHQVDKNKQDKGAKMMLVVFTLGSEEYAMTIDRVKEVVKTPHIAPVPQVPDYIKGITNVRGNVVAVLDLHAKMGMEKDRKSGINYSMVINDEEYKVAVDIDQVPNTMIIHENEIDQSSNIMVNATQDESFIKGIVRRDQRMIILIDVLEMIKNEQFSNV